MFLYFDVLSSEFDSDSDFVIIFESVFGPFEENIGLADNLVIIVYT